MARADAFIDELLRVSAELDRLIADRQAGRLSQPRHDDHVDQAEELGARLVRRPWVWSTRSPADQARRHRLRLVINTGAIRAAAAACPGDVVGISKAQLEELLAEAEQGQHARRRLAAIGDGVPDGYRADPGSA